jgi:hypothetical protein
MMWLTEFWSVAEVGVGEGVGVGVGEGPPAVTEPLPQPETETKRTKRTKGQINLNIEDPMHLIIFDVSSRAVGCPEPLLGLGHSLSQAEKKFIGGKSCAVHNVAHRGAVQLKSGSQPTAMVNKLSLCDNDQHALA